MLISELQSSRLAFQSRTSAGSKSSADFQIRLNLKAGICWKKPFWWKKWVVSANQKRLVGTPSTPLLPMALSSSAKGILVLYNLLGRHLVSMKAIQGTSTRSYLGVAGTDLGFLSGQLHYLGILSGCLWHRSVTDTVSYRTACYTEFRLDVLAIRSPAVVHLVIHIYQAYNQEYKHAIGLSYFLVKT